MGKEFAIAEGKRIEITNEQAKQIRDMYKQIEKEFGERARILSNKSNISSIMREQYLKDFQKDLQDRIVVLNSQLEGTIKDNMLEVAKSVTSCNESMLHEMGFGGVFTSNFYIPQDAVNAVITGKLYEGKWNLSRAIWSDNQKKINDINSIVSKGMAENKSTYEIAKDLERYVNPQARKEWDWSKVYPGTSKKIDYNAQRLARTMVSHAYQEAFVLNTKDNPFIESYRWLASNSDRTCELCEERDGQIYDKDSLPLDHPNGMCTFEIVREKSYEEIASSLRDWVNNEGDSELNKELDKYAETLGYNVKEWTKNTEQVQNAKANPELLTQINRENFDAIARSVNSTLTVEDIDDYVTSSYGAYSLGDKISRFIDKLPDNLKLHDEEIYRGLYFESEKELNNFINNHQIGQVIKTRRDGLSWTTDKSVAEVFSSDVSDYSVILVNSDDAKNAISIKDISDTLFGSSSEVLYSSSTDFEVLEIEKKGANIIMYVTEAISSKEKY